VPTPVSRRTTLAASALLACAPLGACSLRPTPPAAAPAPANPDQPLVDALTTRITALLPGSRAAWYDAHLAQLRALGSDRAMGRRRRSGSGTGPTDLSAERSLGDALVEGAVSAQTPALVRLLASMAAGQAQLLAGA